MADEEKKETAAAAEEVKEETPAEAPKEEVKEETKEAPKEEKPAPAPKKEEPKVEVSEAHKEIVETLKNMTVIELSELVKELEGVFGVSAAAPVAMAGMPGAGPAGGGEAAEEKSAFDVVLTAAGDKKIQVIKEVRTITGLGLKEAKALVDGAPKAVKEGVNKDEADKLKGQLETAGATVELK